MIRYIKESTKTGSSKVDQPYLKEFHVACECLDKAALRRFFQKDIFREITDAERRKSIIRRMTKELLARSYLSQMAVLEHKLGRQHIINSLDEELKKVYDEYRQMVNTPSRQSSFDKKKGSGFSWLKKVVVSVILALIGFLLAMLKYLRGKKQNGKTQEKSTDA